MAWRCHSLVRMFLQGSVAGPDQRGRRGCRRGCSTAVALHEPTALSQESSSSLPDVWADCLGPLDCVHNLLYCVVARPARTGHTLVARGLHYAGATSVCSLQSVFFSQQVSPSSFQDRLAFMTPSSSCTFRSRNGWTMRASPLSCVGASTDRTRDTAIKRSCAALSVPPWIGNVGRVCAIRSRSVDRQVWCWVRPLRWLHWSTLQRFYQDRFGQDLSQQSCFCRQNCCRLV